MRGYWIESREGVKNSFYKYFKYLGFYFELDFCIIFIFVCLYYKYFVIYLNRKVLFIFLKKFN